MITVSKSNNSVSVTGAEAEVMLFYCFWQTSLWPDWMNYSKLGSESDQPTKQHSNAVIRLKDGQGLHLSHSGTEFINAYEFAVTQCGRLGIHISTNH